MKIAVGTCGAARSRRRRLMVAKADIIGAVPGTIIAAIIADHITTISPASAGVHDGFHAVHRHVHVAPHGGFHRVHPPRLIDGESPGRGGDDDEQRRNDQAVAPR